MSSAVQRYAGTFQYAGKRITFHFWVHTDGATLPDTVVFLGTGQNGHIPKWAAKASPVGTIVVDGAPHWHAHPSAHDLYDFMFGYTVAAFHAALNAFGLVGAHIVAHSQATPGAVRLANGFPEHVRNVVLISPLGLTTTHFGDTPEARFRTLQKRGLHSAMQLSQSPFYDPRNLYAALTILRTVVAESERGASKRKYAKGLSYDMLEDCRELARIQQQTGNSFTFVLGGKDRIFVTREILSVLEAAHLEGVSQVVLPGIGHLSLATRAARKVLWMGVGIARGEAPDAP